MNWIAGSPRHGLPVSRLWEEGPERPASRSMPTSTARSVRSSSQSISSSAKSSLASSDVGSVRRKSRFRAGNDNDEPS